MRRRYSNRSITITRSAPSIHALAAANWPTGPAPQIAMTSPRWMSHISAPMYPVGKMSERKSTDSSGTPFSILIGPTSANGTRAYSAWPPAKPPVGERDRGVLGGAAGEAAGEMRVAEDAGRREAEHLLGEPRVRVRVLAE